MCKLCVVVSVMLCCMCMFDVECYCFMWCLYSVLCCLVVVRLMYPCLICVYSYLVVRLCHCVCARIMYVAMCCVY